MSDLLGASPQGSSGRIRIRGAQPTRLTSQGQLIQQAVARFWLEPWQAERLTDGLTRAWKIVLDQNQPRQRADVLAGTMLVLGSLGFTIWANRHAA